MQRFTQAALLLGAFASILGAASPPDPDFALRAANDSYGSAVGVPYAAPATRTANSQTLGRTLQELVPSGAFGWV